MDSRQPFGYHATGADLSYSSHSPVQSISAGLLESLKLNLQNSTNSPFSTHFNSEPLTLSSDSLVQHSSTDYLSGASPSCNSSLETNTYFRHPHQDSTLLYCLGGTSFSNNANSGQNIKCTLEELESALMAPDDEQEVTMPSPSFGKNKWPQTSRCDKSVDGFLSEKRHKVMEEPTSLQDGVPPGNLKQLLILCAMALSENKLHVFENLIEKARSAVSISGEPIQRLGAYMVEGLVAKKEASGTNIYQTLRCKEPVGKDLLTYMQILYEICPYLKFGYMAANGAIAEACRNEDRIHIIDYQISQGTQWMTLLQALAARPSGPPHVRITGIDDPVSKYARGDNLEMVRKRLAAVSDKFNIPIEFHAVLVFASDVTKDMLDVRPGEAVAVNFPLQLHHTPDESVDVRNPRDQLLRMVKSLSPKVVTLVEQESNTNTAPFLARFVEALDYYSAMFESIDVTMPRDNKERINVEQHCLARDMVNVIACEGKERVERHELLGKWKSRFGMAGFRQYPLSSYVNSVIRGLLKYYYPHYSLVEIDGAMLLGWKDRYLISASAWY
ncbi:hypothetical protein U1Q18_024123 [Sarracenia purpurea var. burkii]